MTSLEPLTGQMTGLKIESRHSTFHTTHCHS